MFLLRNRVFVWQKIRPTSPKDMTSRSRYNALPVVVVASGAGDALEELEESAENEDEERSMARYLDAAAAAEDNDTEAVRHSEKQRLPFRDNGNGPIIRDLDNALDDEDDDDAVSFVTTAQQPDGVWRDAISGFLPLNHHDGDNTDSSRSLRSLWNQTFFPDDCFTWRGIVWAEGEFAIKLLKFTALTFGGIVLVFYWVRWMVRV
jgi:hypothetical protein